MTNKPHLKIASRDTAIMNQLQTCSRECAAQNHPGAVLPPDLVNLVTEAATNYRLHYEDLQSKRSLFKDSSRHVRNLENQLRKRLRHAFQGIRRHQDMLALSAASFESFGLTQDGTFTETIKDLREPLQIAKNMLNAHALVEAEGNNCLYDPTAAELQQRIEALETALVNQKSARDDQQAALHQMRETRTSANRVLRTVHYYIKAMTTDVDQVTKRQILRGYGFRFVPSKTGATDAEGVAEAPDEAPVDPAGADSQPATASPTPTSSGAGSYPDADPPLNEADPNQSESDQESPVAA